MQAVVVGGAGFIGSNLVDRLVKTGTSVLVIDNLRGGKKEFLKHHEPLEASGKFGFIEMDVRDTNKLVQMLPKDTDIVYHLAANADISLGATDPTFDFEHSIVATFSLLRAMKENGIKNLVYTSGSGVYGDQGTHRSAESFGPLTPISMYGAGKLGAEGLISAFAHLCEMKVWIARPANITGPRATHGVTHDFVRSLLKKPTELRILGNGKQLRSYLHVDDVIDALFLIQKKSKSTVNIFNLSSDSFVVVDEIAEIVIQTMGLKGVKINRGKESFGWKGDVPIVRISNAKIKKLGWKAKYNSKQAVAATVKALLADEQFVKLSK